MMHRLENNLDRLEGIVSENGEAITRNTEAVAKLVDGMRMMQAPSWARLRGGYSVFRLLTSFS